MTERERFLAWVAADPATTPDHDEVAKAIADGRQPSEDQRVAADQLAELGYLARNADGTYEALPGDPRKWRRPR